MTVAANHTKRARAWLARLALALLAACPALAITADPQAQASSAAPVAEKPSGQSPPGLSALVAVQPSQATLQVGATRQFTLVIEPGKSNAPQQVYLASSDPATVRVSASVSVPRGSRAVQFSVQALRAGSAQLTAELVQGNHHTRASVQVQVVPDPPRVVSLQPASVVLQQGAGGQVVARISGAQRTATRLDLAARDPGIVNLPASITVPAGQTEAAFDLKALAPGSTFVVASIGASTAEAAVRVLPAPVVLSSLQPSMSMLVVSAQAQLTATLSATPSVTTTLALSSDPPGIVQVPSQLVLPPGQASGAIAVTALKPGAADVLASLGTPGDPGTRRASIRVTPQPAALAALLPNPASVQRGASANLIVRLQAAQAEVVSVALVAQRPDVVRVPTSVSIPPGQLEQAVALQALAAGESIVTASLNGTQQSALVQVTLPPPRLAPLEPATQDLPKGRLGRVVLSLDRVPQADTVVTLATSDDSVLQLPAQVTVPAGQQGVDIPVSARSQGLARVQATLESQVQTAEVQVGAPALVAIELRPAKPSLSPGQRIQLEALGTYSDGSTRDVAADPATTWSSSAPAVATVDALGRLTGLGQGEAKASAVQAVQPTWDNPQPSLVAGQAVVSVGAPAPLAMAAARTALVVGETASVSITTPYPAGALPYVLQLSAEGGSLQVPASVTIGPGLTSATFTVRATAPGAVQLRAQGGPFAPAQLAITVQAAVPTRVVVSGIEPDRAAVGALVTLAGEGFAASATANSVAFAGNVPAQVLAATATSLQVRVPESAQSGPVSVTNALGTAASPTFTVVREQDFGLQASPAQLQLMQASNAQVVLQLASNGTRAYQGLARLTATGLPDGVTARFEPAMLSAYQTGRLVLQAAAGASLGSATVTITAEATLDGLPWVRQARVKVELVSGDGVTGVKGRFVTPEGAGIAGVIVRQDTTTRQVVTDAAGNFLITGLPSGVTTLRFDATPANSLYPIWPYNVTLAAGQLLTMDDWVINPPPPDERFKAIDNATRDQQVTDERFPGFAVVLPAGVSITGWDGVKKTRIAVEKVTPDRLPVGPPPFPMKEAYQLYFGTPMGGIPSSPIPVQLPNVAEREPGEKVEIWWFDGSPMGGTGDWKLAGLGTVSADGRTVASDPGVGLPRFCGVCGLVSLSCPPPPTPPQPPPTCPAASAGNPVDLFTGQEMPSTSGPSCGGATPIDAGLRYNPIDAFNNRAGTIASFGFGWTFNYDISFLPFDGPQKRLILPGGRFVNLVDDGSGKYRPVDDPTMAGTYAKDAGGGRWDVVRSDGTRWRFEPFAGITGLLRGGPPLFVTEITDPNGNVTRIARQPNGRILQVAGVEERSLSLAYGANGFVTSLKDHTGRTQSFEYTSSNRVTKVIDVLGRSTEYGYSPLPVLENHYFGCLATDSSGRCVSSYSYRYTACEQEVVRDFQGLSSIKYPTSETPTLNTYGTDRIVKQTTSTGQEWKFSYRRAGACVAKLLQPPRSTSNSVETYAFTCRAGQTLTKRVCTGVGQQGACTDQVVGTCPDVDSEESRAAGWRFYGGSNVETRVVDPAGQQTRFKFNARGLPTEQTDELGQVTRHVYDAQNRKVRTIDPLGRETRFEYDSAGNRTATVDPLGRRVETSYDTQSNKPTGSTRYLLGVPSTQGGRPLSYTPVQDSMSYDARGNLSTMLDPTGFVTRMGYDSRGLLQQVVLPVQAGATQVPVINEATAATVPATSRTFRLSHSAAGDLSAVTDPLGNETRLTADALGRPNLVTDPLGYSQHLQFDALDQPTVSTNALGQDSRNYYDSAGRLLAVVNPAGVPIERYAYDARGRLTSVIDALANGIQVAYDSSGRPGQITDRKGQVTRIGYDARGRVIQVSKPDQELRMEYDAVGRLGEMRDNASTTTWQYDEADRVVQVDTTTASGSHRLHYDYDSLDRVTRRTLSGTGIAQPEATTYQWDLANRLLSLTTTIAGQSHLTRFEYDAGGRLAARKVQSGSRIDAITQRYGWDAADRLAQIRYVKAEGTPGEQLIEQIDYGYDARGQRVARRTLNNNGTGLSDTPMQASYDAANRMTDVTLQLPAGAKSYRLAHDTNGNLVEKVNEQDASDKTQYRWDVNDRLVGMVQPGLEARFVYDALGRRVQASITRTGQAPATVQYLYEGQQALGEIRDGRLTHRLLTGLSLDEVIARLAIAPNGQRDPAASRLYLTDALNSVIAQLADDSDAAVQNSYAYSPYGESQTVGVDPTENPIQYTGRENDGTGLYFYRARYLEPGRGRFISSDPTGLDGGPNVYGYVASNPVGLVDPTGEIGIGGALIGVGVELGIQAFRNYREGCELFDAANYDWWDVAVSGAVGAMAPGFVAVGKTGWTSGKAIQVISSQSANTASRAAKNASRIAEHQKKIKDVAMVQGSYQLGKAIAKGANGRGGDMECSCRK